ncbi:MAG: putative transposase [Lentisphaeria bacterium]|jgi:putative transposase
MPPKESVAKLLGTVKGKTAIQIFRQFRYLKSKLYWRNHFWARGYCVDAFGIDEASYVSMSNTKKKRKRSRII